MIANYLVQPMAQNNHSLSSVTVDDYPGPGTPADHI